MLAMGSVPDFRLTACVGMAGAAAWNVHHKAHSDTSRSNTSSSRNQRVTSDHSNTSQELTNTTGVYCHSIKLTPAGLSDVC